MKELWITSPHAGDTSHAEGSWASAVSVSPVDVVKTIFSLSFWRPLLACRLCRSVAFSVFLLILAIESVILLPSSIHFYYSELRRLEEKATATINAALPLDEPIRTEQFQHLVSGSQRATQILGLSILNTDGKVLVRIGDADFDGLDLEPIRQDSLTLVRRRIQDGRCYDIAWRQVVKGKALLLVVRMDSSALNKSLLSFMLRIALLVALIVAVVTSGTMAVLYRVVLNPILRLRGSMLAAAANPDRAQEFRVREHPSNELGDVFDAHNQMLCRVAESKLADKLRSEEQARFLVRHDTLTGLPNRAFFLEYLQQSLLASFQRSENVAVFVLNLAAFRAINDGLGQAAGDQVLREAARRLNEGLQLQQFVARLAGDDFGIAWVGQIQPADSSAYAEQILAKLRQPFDLNGTELRLHARIGIAQSNGQFIEPETLLHDANLALSRARDDPQTRYQFFAPSMTEDARQRQDIERELRGALERDELQLFYQAKVDINSAKVVACEALIRWRHPIRGMLSPAAFIPIAEATGLILQLGDWALHAACAQICAWREQNRIPPRIAVNLSPAQFRDPDLPDRVGTALRACGIEPGLIELEITESVAMEDAAITMKTLSSLRQLGVSLSIDDFGTGYSSLSYLRKFEVDSIKIDKSFVDDIGGDANADAICEAIINLGRSLGKRIVAEGVETVKQLDFLRSRGCHEAQGYLFGRPIPASEFVVPFGRGA